MEISVIIPSYKPGNYIWKCLDSLCTQTLASNLYEIVIILNGCYEPYYSTLSAYAQKHPNTIIRIIHIEEAGVSQARNTGISIAHGNFIAFIDDDDWVTCDYLECLLSISRQGIIAVSNAIQFDENGNEMDYFYTKAYIRNVKAKKMTLFHARSFLSPVWGKIIPRNVIGNTRFNTKYKLGEDSLFMFQISKRIADIRIAPSNTYYAVRYRDNSASHSHYHYLHRLKVSLLLSYSYIKIYLSDIHSYNFILFATRVFATLRKLFYRRYE